MKFDPVETPYRDKVVGKEGLLPSLPSLGVGWARAEFRYRLPRDWAPLVGKVGNLEPGFEQPGPSQVPARAKLGKGLPDPRAGAPSPCRPGFFSPLCAGAPGPPGRLFPWKWGGPGSERVLSPSPRCGARARDGFRGGAGGLGQGGPGVGPVRGLGHAGLGHLHLRFCVVPGPASTHLWTGPEQTLPLLLPRLPGLCCHQPGHLLVPSPIGEAQLYPGRSWSAGPAGFEPVSVGRECSVAGAQDYSCYVGPASNGEGARSRWGTPRTSPGPRPRPLSAAPRARSQVSSPSADLLPLSWPLLPLQLGEST